MGESPEGPEELLCKDQVRFQLLGFGDMEGLGFKMGMSACAFVLRFGGKGGGYLDVQVVYSGMVFELVSVPCSLGGGGGGGARVGLRVKAS